MYPQISDLEFQDFQVFVHEQLGIHLHAGKKALVSGRLNKRLQHFQLRSFAAYFELIHSAQGKEERQICIDLLTTNETYFFREPKHFEWLRHHAAAATQGPLRVWSAASSSGDEAYSIAMVLAAHGVQPWQVLGSDISTRMLECARRAHYSMARAKSIPEDYLKRFCLRGTGQQEGTFLVRRELREQVDFLQLNLNTTLPSLGQFDIIFLRNVMIYFDTGTKQKVVQRLLHHLKPGGHLCIGHSESLNDLSHPLVSVAPAIFRLPDSRAPV